MEKSITHLKKKKKCIPHTEKVTKRNTNATDENLMKKDRG